MCFTPVDSVMKSSCPLPPKMGSSAMLKNTMPRPPIHCVRLRQKSKPWGRASMLSRMLAPVVVKPDMVSKKASVTLGI